MNNKQWDAIWVNARLATLSESNTPYGLMDAAALAVKDGKIAWIGAMAELPGVPALLATEVHDVGGRCITPGLIDCHTHLVYAGNRAREFEMRLQGVSYEDIARQGGGIRATVAATRLATEEELFAQSLRRARALLHEGVTTLEIKSGYGLDLNTELKILRVAKRLQDILPITVVATFLGAHALPEEFNGRADDYITEVCERMIPEIARLQLASAIDVFCETIAFNLAQTKRVFEAAKKAGLSVRCHAEQLSHSGAAKLAAEYGALAVDHLEYLTEADVKYLATSGTVAVLLPGAFYYLRETKMPPIELFRKYRVPMAIASDCNPGTSPIASLLLMLNMACILFRLTPEEAWMGVTRHAAKALGLAKKIGTLAVGKEADMIIWDVEHPAELAYAVGFYPARQVVKQGNKTGSRF